MQDRHGREIAYEHVERGHVYTLADNEVVLPQRDDDKAAELLGMAADPPAPDPVVPQVVTLRQAHQAVILNGLLGAVEAAIAAIPDETERALAEAEWNHSQEVRRNRGLVQRLGAAIGLTEQQIDNLFIQAAALP